MLDSLLYLVMSLLAGYLFYTRIYLFYSRLWYYQR